MNRLSKHGVLAMLLGAAAVVACDKNGRQDITAPATGARVKFFNFAVNAPGVNFYANDSKITAVTTGVCSPSSGTRDTTTLCNTTGNEAATGTNYGSAGNGGLYNDVAPGSVKLASEIAATTDKGLPISSVTTSLDDGKYYSYFVSGMYNSTTKQADAFVVEDPLPATADYSHAYVRFVNAISNSQPMTLYVKGSTATSEIAVGAAVAYKGAGAFTPVPPDVYELDTRATGSGTNLITRTGVSFVAGHMYTITSRGDMTSTATATKPALDNTANQ